MLDACAKLITKALAGDTNAKEEAEKIVLEIAALAQDDEFQAEMAKEGNIQKIQDAVQKFMEAVQGAER